MAENSPAEADGPTVELSAPVRESPTMVGAPGVGAPPAPPPALPPAPGGRREPGAPPPLPAVTMPPAAGVAPRTVVLIAVLAALVAALLTAGLFLVFG